MRENGTQSTDESAPEQEMTVADIRGRMDELAAQHRALQETLAEITGRTDGPGVETAGRHETEEGTLLFDGSNETYKILGQLDEPSEGIGVLGCNIASSGTTYGVKGEVDSTDGYGLATPDDALLKGTLDTDETDFVVKTGVSGSRGPANVVIGHPDNRVGSDVVGATISGGGSVNVSDEENRVTDDYATVAGGRGNQAGDDNDRSDSAKFAAVGGGLYNKARASKTTIGGGWDNEASTSGATVGGGIGNEASGVTATVGGGDGNTASAGDSTVSGGIDNTASAEDSTVSGGIDNTASGTEATVGGGDSNTASGEHATVPGGEGNLASGDQSFAAGTWAAADANWSFVWNDGSGEQDSQGGPNDRFKATTSDDSGVVSGFAAFNVKATGGVRFITESDNSLVTYIPADSSGWSNASSRAVKTNIDPVDPEQALDGVDSMEVATWEYESENEETGTTHIGPMAEGFHDAFDVGNSDEHINSINADGVAFAAIQGLSQKLDEKDDRIDALEADCDALQAENEQLRDRLAAIESHLDCQ